MKKLIILLSFFFLFACAEKENKVKVIENYDADYLSSENVDKEPGTDEQLESLLNEIKDVVGEVSKDYSLPAKAFLNYRIYINTDGKVEGIKPLPISEKYLIDESYEIIETEVLTPRIASSAENWEFTPAVKNGKSVKFRGDIELIITVDENGKILEEIPALNAMGKTLAKLKFVNKEEYLIVVDEQPFPVGGMKAIQEKIVYPERAKQNGIEGRVFVKAYINEEGSVDEIILLKGFDAECDSVAMEAICQTKFTPAKQKGEPVKSQVSIPIVFKLN
jgi:protein TonB